jgi:hypothetical protein
MSLEETAKLLSESRIIVDQGKESNDVAYLLNLILSLVSSFHDFVVFVYVPIFDIKLIK